MEIGTIVVEITLREIGINNDNDWLLNQISTTVTKEQQGNKLYFYPENTRELSYIDSYIRNIMILTSFEEAVEEVV